MQLYEQPQISYALSVIRTVQRQSLPDDTKYTMESLPTWCCLDSSSATEEGLRLQIKSVEESPKSLHKDTKREWIADVFEDIDQIRVYELPHKKYIDEQLAIMHENLRDELTHEITAKIDELRPLLEPYKNKGSSGVKWTDVIKILLDVFRILYDIGLFKLP